MSYIEKEENQDETLQNEETTKNPLKALFAEDTAVENPEDIIDRDPDVNRKKAFLEAFANILALLPESVKKKKRKRTKEQEKFQENVVVKDVSKQRDVKSIKKEVEKEIDREREQ